MVLAYAPWGESAEEWLAAGVAAEDAGFVRLWSSELHRNPFVLLTAVSQRARRIGIGTAVALAFVRSPFATAIEALDVDEVSGGRFTLGLGTGVRRLNEDWHARPFDDPVGRLTEAVAVIRSVAAGAHGGEPLAFAGRHERLDVRGFRRPVAPATERLPIYLAAVGPRLLALAGEVADGWIGHELGSPEHLREVVLPRLHEGEARAGRSPGAVRVVASACVSCDRDGATARRWAAGTVAFYASVRTYAAFFERHGAGSVPVAVQERLRAGDLAGAVDAVPDDLVDRLCIAGTPDEVRRGLRRYEGLCDELKVSPPSQLVAPEITRSCQASIMEVLAA